MSDFIYSSKTKPEGLLRSCIQTIYHNDPPEIQEYHGRWGSLAVSRSLYCGFQPLETTRYLFIVIGGPVLYFRDNFFLTGDDPVAGTMALFDRWQSSAMKWDEDLSGPFVILAVDKEENTITCITDLLMFIPLYQLVEEGEVYLSTHVDALARAVDMAQDFDPVSLVDFILHDVVTYPFTAYKNIRQGQPAAVHHFQLDGDICRAKRPIAYWVPKEHNSFENIGEAAKALREGLCDDVNRVTEGMTHVAHFLSAGEDSRAICAILPRGLKRDAFVFLDSMNREGKIAGKVAKVYGAAFQVGFRKKTHYLEILPEAANLIGSGHQYVHAHTLKFHKTYSLSCYSAVFGGFVSDTLLKGHHIKKHKICRLFPFLPQFPEEDGNFLDGKTKDSLIFQQLPFFPDVIERRKNHWQKISSFRKNTIKEWFNLWPLTMSREIPNIFCNRRLFSSYEPFTCKHVVKISAAVPTSWKMNRRLFNISVRSFLEPSRWIFHGDGRLPYFPWWANVPIQFGTWFVRQVATRTGLIKGHQGSWADWREVIASQQWQKVVSRFEKSSDSFKGILPKKDLAKVFAGDELSLKQKVNLMQVLYQLTNLNPPK